MELHSCFAALPSFPNNFIHLRIIIEILLVITQWPSLQLIVPDLQVEYIIVERRFAFSGVAGRSQCLRMGGVPRVEGLWTLTRCVVQLSGASFPVQRAALSGPCLCPQFEASLLGSRSLCSQAGPQSPLCSSSAGSAAGVAEPRTPPQIQSPCSPPLSFVWQCCVLLASCLVSCPPRCLSHGCP